MKTVVCVKAVPHIIGSVRLQENSRDIVRSDFSYKINDTDDNALEEAILLRERYGGKVTVLTLCPRQEQDNSKQILWECYAKGADEAVLLVDELFANIDTYVAAKVLANAIQAIPYDLVLTGSQGLDDNFGHVGPMAAAFLGVPYATLALKIQATPEKLMVWTELDDGFRQVVELTPPAVVTVQSGINEPRYASLSRIRAAQNKPIRILSANDLNVSADSIELWRKWTVQSFSLPRKNEIQFIDGTLEEVTSTLAELIRKIRETNP